ncbi:MAG: hypothetical protein M1816_003714 [Peltula sp. TS41687]|nr:MAG: hypothetical protein M1816_003714 [Peltula sp. TS41687]
MAEAEREINPNGDMTIHPASISLTEPASAGPLISPLISPTLTQVAAGTPIVSPIDLDELVPDFEQSLELAQRVPLPSPSPSEDHVRMMAEDPDVEQWSRPLAHRSKSMPVLAHVNLVPRLPLEDVSRYTEPSLPAVARPISPTTLAELAHLFRLERDQSRKYYRLRERLYQCLTSNALSARLGRCAHLAQSALAEYFWLDDKRGFASLFDALHDVRLSCDATYRYAYIEPDLGVHMPEEALRGKEPPFPTFLHEIPGKMRDDLLHFISQIRTNPDFLAGRIVNLSSSELLCFSTSYQLLEPTDSVLSAPPRGRPQGSSIRRGVGLHSSPVERLLSFQRHDPLSGLLYTCFANSGGPHAPDDLRRTDVWSSTCARLITEGTRGGEQFMRVVLNAWSALRDWPAKERLELYLMKTLQDGAYLLDRADQQVPGTKHHSDTSGSKEGLAPDDFFDITLKRLFETIDGPAGVEGLPQGVLDLGNAILRKLKSSKKQRAARTFIISKWFFSSYLLNAIIYPETHGMMVNYHISTRARKRILEEIATRAQRLVWEVAVDWKPVIPIHPDIRSHIDNIFAKLQDSPSSALKIPLSPASTITSPRETSEMQPFLVLCPSDIITLVNTLFPEPRPSSSLSEVDRSHSGLWSSASSVSGVSLLSQPRPPSRDLGSLLSNSGSSLTSGSTSQDPVLDSLGQNPDARSSYTSIGSRDTLLDVHQSDSIEAFGQILRTHVMQLSSYLGINTTKGTSNPCAERWAVLFISSDDGHLSMSMPQDAEGDEDDNEDAIENAMTDEVPQPEPETEHNYEELKQTVSRLLQDYEIPRYLVPESESKCLSNRLSALRRTSRRIDTGDASPSRDGLGMVPEANPSYHHFHGNEEPGCSVASEGCISGAITKQTRISSNNQTTSLLLTMLEGAITDSQAKSDFVKAHSYWEAMRQLRELSTSSLALQDYAPLLNYFARGPRESISRAVSATDEYEAWLVWLQQSQERHQMVIDDTVKQLQWLRDKMWYVTDVQHSAAYEEAKTIAIALRSMGQPVRTSRSKTPMTTKSRSSARSMASNLLLRSETQILDLMTAPNEQGGSSKLSDHQSDMTLKWLVQSGVDNYCKGEERIHRFCLEMDRCLKKLIGDDITDAPVLWSSDLYHRDRWILSNGFQKGDLCLTEFGTLRPIGDDDRNEGRRTPVGYDYSSRLTSRDRRPGWTENKLPQAVETRPWNGTGGRSPMEFSQSPARYSRSNSGFWSDAPETFWSPFLSQSQPRVGLSRQSSQRSLFRQDSNLLRPTERSLSIKQKFLLELRQTLTELLLSDLGTMVWNRGSETDSWFSGELGEKFLQRIESKEPDNTRTETGNTAITLDQAKGDPDSDLLINGVGLRVQSDVRASVLCQDGAAEQPQCKDGTWVSGAANVRMMSGIDAGVSTFPFSSSFRSLLELFSTHISPFVKLRALHELELMIIASLDVRNRPLYNPPRQSISDTMEPVESGGPPNMGSSQTTAQGWEGLPATIGEEQKQSRTPKDPTISPGTSESQPSFGASKINSVISIMQTLFRESDIRPKTLFRDLQFIAVFVPRLFMDKTESSRAFRTASLAAIGLKQEVCRMMIEMADNIVAYHTKSRTIPPGRPTVDDDNDQSSELSRYSMGDAARMLTIAAKEGYPVAQRELAIFYLTHPDLVVRTMLPLSKPSDTFKAQMMNQRDGDPARSDPATLCVAYHWMELSSQGGDELARQNMRTREELNALP